MKIALIGVVVVGVALVAYLAYAAGADGRWWRELRGAGAPVQLLVRGATLSGLGRAIEDDPAHRADVFSRLRPTAPQFTGTLVQVDLVANGRTP